LHQVAAVQHTSTDASCQYVDKVQWIQSDAAFDVETNAWPDCRTHVV